MAFTVVVLGLQPMILILGSRTVLQVIQHDVHRYKNEVFYEGYEVFFGDGVVKLGVDEVPYVCHLAFFVVVLTHQKAYLEQALHTISFLFESKPYFMIIVMERGVWVGAHLWIVQVNWLRYGLHVLFGQILLVAMANHGTLELFIVNIV